MELTNEDELTEDQGKFYRVIFNYFYTNYNIIVHYKIKIIIALTDDKNWILNCIVFWFILYSFELSVWIILKLCIYNLLVDTFFSSLM